MTEKTPRARTKAPAKPAMPPVQSVMVSIGDVRPYEQNPRDNAAAIDAVAQSIQNYGFLVPIVVDMHGVIVAGHTRYAASVKLGLSEVPVVYASHLTERQVQAFRLVDNKTAELATWDMDMLAREVQELVDSGVDLVPFGWTQEEVDCLSSMVASDCLSTVMDEDQTDGLVDRAAAGGGDGVNGAIQTNKGTNAVSKDPKSVRVAVGEINFFVDIEQFRDWSHELRKRNGFDMERVIADLSNRLGIQPRPMVRTAKQKQAEQAAMIAAQKEEAKKTGKPLPVVKREAAIAKRTRTRNPEATLKSAVEAAES